MARVYLPINGGPAARAVTAVDTSLPSAPIGTDAAGTPVSPCPAGVYNVAGAKTILIDVLPPSGATGNTGITMFVWSQPLRAWSQIGPEQVQAVATKIGAVGTVAQRLTYTDFGGDWVFVAVTTLATGGGAGVGTQLSVTWLREDG